MSARPLLTLSLPPATLSALAAAGYELISELAGATPEQLARELNLDLPASQALLSAARPAPTGAPATQSAAALIRLGASAGAQPFPTSCGPLDDLLQGGLRRGTVLELSGPPGCGAAQVVARVPRAFVDAGEGVLFVDMQGMTPPAVLARAIDAGAGAASDSEMGAPTAQARRDLVQYLALRSPLELVVFLRNLPAYLAARPSISLLVLNSLSFPLQGLTNKDRDGLLDTVKQTLARARASMSLCTVITSHLLSRPAGDPADPGAPADAAGRWVMAPAFASHRFTQGHTHRVLIVPQTKDSGVMRLLDPRQPREARFRRVAGRIERGRDRAAHHGSHAGTQASQPHP
ncbi:P-loop containing nucleoside triphosphate hydrolase protein [Epithele typhae]|uniref:P-loop containing nucleoside triphosphate hydrolase protein n=1 Tax=Epithele typhae TaxID=378194 RepID=UPI0020082EF7|nr:P-loop containing nucleoside triphosphate hydrolase protein [Epithele typhae]KAH9941801.1 P-loop containing nucleoside triphosphate hydrolase protein [Epithele typhae]